MSSSPTPHTTASSLALYRRLFGYLKNYLRIFALAVLDMVVVAATGPIFAWLLKPLINEGFVEKNLSAMRWVPLAIIGLFIVRGIFNFINEYSECGWLNITTQGQPETQKIQRAFAENRWYAWSRVYHRKLFAHQQFEVGKLFEDFMTVPYLYFAAERIFRLPWKMERVGSKCPPYDPWHGA